MAILKLTILIRRAIKVAEKNDLLTVAEFAQAMGKSCLECLVHRDAHEGATGCENTQARQLMKRLETEGNYQINPFVEYLLTLTWPSRFHLGGNDYHGRDRIGAGAYPSQKRERKRQS